MKIVKPSFIIESKIDAEEILKHIEKAGRTAYKSEDKITEKSAKKFVKKIMNFKHESVIEHHSITVRVICDRGACYDDKTEVLTKEGWKFFKDTTDKDEFLTVNMDSKDVEYQKRTAVTNELYDGEMIYGKSTMVDFAVTPNHRMVYFHYDSRKPKWGIKHAEDIYNKRVKFQRGLFKKWEGEEIDLKINSKFNIPINSLAFAKFMGIWFTDGSIYKHRDSGGKVKIHQIKKNGRDFIEEILDELNISYRMNKLNDTYVIYDTDLYRFLKNEFPEAKRKLHSKIPKWIRNAPSEWIEGFIEGCIVGDGNIHKSNGHKVLYTVNKDIANGYQECLLKIGLSSSIREDNRIGESHMLNGSLIKRNMKSYIVSITTKTNEHLFNKKHWCKKHYKGSIHCVTVPNGTLYIRRNGKAMWSGNSHEVVRHRLASYTQESTRYVNYSKGKYGSEITVIEPSFFKKGSEQYKIWEKAMRQAEKSYMELIKSGASPQEARSALPTSLKTEVVITMNLRNWRHFFELRTHKAAHPQIREIAIPLLEEFKKQLPVIFDDIVY